MAELQFAAGSGATTGKRGRRKMSDEEKAVARINRDIARQARLAGPTAVVVADPTPRRKYTRRSGASKEVTALAAQNSELQAAVRSNRSKLSGYMKQMFSPMGKAQELAAAFVGGYSYGRFSEFVLKSLANGDPSAWIYRYRAALVAGVAVFGDKVIPKNVANNQYFIAGFQGMIGAAAASFAEDRRAMTSTQSAVTKGVSDGGYSIRGQLGAGGRTYDVNASLSQLSGLQEYDRAIETGFMPTKFADMLAKQYIKSALEGDKAAKGLMSDADLDACNGEQRDAAIRLSNALNKRTGDNISSVLNT